MKPQKKLPKKKDSQKSFPESISGLSGSFVTPAGTVSYLLTKATLRFKGEKGGEEEQNSRLTTVLAPVREIIDVSQLGFDQLLQRDLDDNRIAHELIPYILGGKKSGKPLFPPIVAMLVPFADGVMKKSYGSVEPAVLPNAEWESDRNTITFGDYFRIETPPEGSLTPHAATLRWNQERTKLVVLDGQHRAMALLAIHRVKTSSWPPGAAKFQTFYKEFVEHRLKAAETTFPDLIELPVMLVWVPDPNADLPGIVRKLFVDINNNARIPSPSRILLLSDEYLDNHLTRRLLTLIRTEESGVPLTSVEYDYPSKGNKIVGRWSCVSNIEILRELIRWLINRSDLVLHRMDIDVVRKGRMEGPIFDKSLRKELKVATLGKTFEDGEAELKTADFSNDVFPRFNKAKMEELLQNFDNYHGKPLIELLSRTAPFSAHFTAIKEFQEKFFDNYDRSIVAGLCHEALFEGQGVYWTIKKGHESGKNKNLSQCWKALSKDMMERFCELRAERYCGSKLSGDDLKMTNLLFDQLRTIAAQGGLALLFGSLTRTANANTSKKKIDLAKRIANAISASLTGADAKKSRFCLIPRQKDSLNLIGRLDPKFAGHWRYLWFEVMLRSSGIDGLVSCGVSVELHQSLIDQARTYYIHEMIKLRIKDLNKPHPTRKPDSFRDKATSLVIVDLVDAFTKSLGYKKPEANRIWSEALNRSPGPNDITEVEDEDMSNGDDEDDLI